MNKLVLIDGSNVWASAKSCGYSIDYEKIINFFGVENKFIFYTALPDRSERNQLQPLVDYLKYNHFQCVTKEMKVYHNEDGNTKRKGNMDMEIARDMMVMARHYKHISLFSGDGDFCCIIDHIQRYHGCTVDVYSSKAMFSNDIRAQADNFYLLDDPKLRASLAAGEKATKLVFSRD